MAKELPGYNAGKFPNNFQIFLIVEVGVGHVVGIVVPSLAFVRSGRRVANDVDLKQ